MKTLLWKVGNTYHLCGEGAETSTYASLAGDYLRLFLPVYDMAAGPGFVTGKQEEVEESSPASNRVAAAESSVVEEAAS